MYILIYLKKSSFLSNNYCKIAKMILSGKQTGRRADLSSDKNSLNLWVNMFFINKIKYFYEKCRFFDIYFAQKCRFFDISPQVGTLRKGKEAFRIMRSIVLKVLSLSLFTEEVDVFNI